MANVIKKDIPMALSNEMMTQITNENGGNRKYKVNGRTYTSVTSIIGGLLKSYGLEKWKQEWIDNQLTHFEGWRITPQLANEIVTASSKEAEESARIGTEMHDIIERLLRGEDVNDVPDQLEPAVRAWLKWRKEFIEWELVATEVGVFNPHAAGQVDALFRKGNDYLVVDWKTSSGLYDSSFLQVAAYAKALSHMYPFRYTSLYDSGININSVQACVVRLVNDYPRLPNKKKNRREPKVFSDRCEYVMVDTDMWYETFVSLVRLSHRMKEKVQKVRL